MRRGGLTVPIAVLVAPWPAILAGCLRGLNHLRARLAAIGGRGRHEVCTMRILGPNGPAAATTAPAARRSASGSFTLPEEEAQAAPAGTAGVRTVGGIDA